MITVKMLGFSSNKISSFPAYRVRGPEYAGEHAGQPGEDFGVDILGNEELHCLDLASAPRRNLAVTAIFLQNLMI